MINQALNDSNMQKILARKANIFTPEYFAAEDCLWVTGTGVHSAYRQMFVNLEQDGCEVIVSVTITDDDRGFTNSLIWGFGDNQDKGAVAQLILFIIEDLLTGNGMPVSVYQK